MSKISELDLSSADEYVEPAAEVLTSAGQPVIAEVEATQYFTDPGTGASGQPTYGIAVQIDPSTFLIGTAGGDGSTFLEVKVFELTLCDNFPDCEGSHLRGVNLGGSSGLDLAQAIRDAFHTLQEGQTPILDAYEWAFELSGPVAPIAQAEAQLLPLK